MPKKERFELIYNVNLHMLSKQLTLSNWTYEKLFKILGLPNGDGTHEKVNREWVFIDKEKNGSIVTLFDVFHPSEKKETWHVGALKKEHALDFIKWLERKQ